MQRRVVAQAPFVIYVTSEFLQKRYPTRGRSFAISNVELPDTGVCGKIYGAEDAHRTEKGNQAVLHLVTVASVSTPYKGQQDVIKAVSVLRQMGIECEYHLIGGGSTDRLKAVADREDVLDRVHFHGAVRHADIFPLLQTMDVYIQPSRQEGLPRALIEAMSCGLPAIGATTGGIPELLPTELLYRPGDIPHLVQLIRQLADQTTRQTEAIRNMRQAAQFSAASLETKRKSVYDEFLSMHGLA
jgi:glycosyltransferase involved in cell wall biosynthesis